MSDPRHSSVTGPDAIPASSNLPPTPSRRKFLKGAFVVLAGLLGCSAVWYRRGWQSIVIHHSAGDFGNVKFLDKVHRQRQPYDPIDSMAYHFIVGNGKGMPEGQVAYGLRWRNRLWGAHVSAANSRYNYSGIGICMVGNYHLKPVPEAQYTALVDLIRQLKTTCGISAANIYPHCRLDGERTVCPGKYFPYDRLYRDVA